MSIQRQLAGRYYDLADKAQTLPQLQAAQQRITGAIQDDVLKPYEGVPLVQDLTVRIQKAQQAQQAQMMQQYAPQPQGMPQGQAPAPVASQIMAQAQQTSGVSQLPSNLPAEEGYAAGGIIAFADGGDAEEDDSYTADDREEANLMSLMDMARAKIRSGIGAARAALPQSYEKTLAAQPAMAQTTANTQDGLSGLLGRAAAKHSLPPELLQRIAGSESGGSATAANPRSSAKGIFQFTDSTWRSMGGREGEQFNPEINTELGAKYVRQNAEGLKNALGRNPTYGEVYASHFFGLQGAKDLLRMNPKTPMNQAVSSQVIKANPNLRGKTVGEVLGSLQSKMGEGIVSLAQGGVIAFKNKGKVEGSDDEEDNTDYAGYVAAAPAAYEIAKNIVTKTPKVPVSAISGLPTAAARTAGSSLASYLGLAGETAIPAAAIGVGGYKLSQAAARTLARPEMAENRRALQDNPMLGAMSSDDAFAAAILDAADAKTNEVLRKAPPVDETEKERERNRFASFEAQNKPYIQEMNALAAKEKQAAAAPTIDTALQQAPQPEAVDPYLQKYMEMLQGRETESAKQKETDKYLALLQAGLGMMGGTSPYAMVNIGQGATQGVGALMAANKQRAAEDAATLGGYGKLYTAKQAADLKRELTAANIDEKARQFDTEQYRRKGVQIEAIRKNVTNEILKRHGLGLEALNDPATATRIQAEAEQELMRNGVFPKLYREYTGTDFSVAPLGKPASSIYTEYTGLKQKPKE